MASTYMDDINRLRSCGVLRPCIKAMGEGLDEYSAAMASEEDS